jgi:mRNA-degrading endonuclease RelE of RelBE toxin-antitoxin system
VKLNLRRCHNFGMSNTVSFTPEFKRRIKPLAKKYFTLRESITDLENELIKDPFIGESYGANIYKIRLADRSKGKGKSGGFRVMYYTVILAADSVDILLVTIYDKSEMDTINKKDALALIDKILSEMQ